MRLAVAKRIVAGTATILSCLIGQAGLANAQSPAASTVSEIITAKLEQHTIAGLVSRQPDRQAFKHGIVLFPGYPGIMRLREENGAPAYELKGNFLLRSSEHWLDADTLVVAADAPSDEWNWFSQRFRATPRYGADIASLLKEVESRYAVGEWTFVGTSEGSISAYHAARMNPALAKRVILTASVFTPSRNGPGLSGASPDELKMSVLLVHHEDDPCNITRHKDSAEFAAKGNYPLITVKGGGPGRGNPCMAFTAHGFVGVEMETVQAMRAWVQTGQATAVVSPK